MNLKKTISLIFVEINKNSNKVWEGELYDDNTVITRWGRVGQPLQSKTFPGVGDKFLLRKEQEKLKKGYEALKIIKNETVQNDKIANIKEVAKKQIKFSNPILGDLIERLVSFNIHNITSNTSIKYDTKSGNFTTPLGLIKQEGIDEARILLTEINDFLKKNTTAKLNTAVNKYLKLIPQDIGFRKLDVKLIFPNDNAIKKQSDILDSLEVSLNKAIVPTKKKAIEEKIFDVELDYLDKTDSEYLRLSKYYTASNQATHGYTNVKIQNIYKIKIQSNIDKYKVSNPVVEVFHGTSGANCLSILKSGLRAVPPSTAAIAGAMFGPGIYGATDSSKSLQYTAGRFGGKNTGLCYMFICDFSMGKYYEIKAYGGRKPAGYDTIWAKAKNTGLRFDELIVPDNHVKIKYLLELK